MTAGFTHTKTIMVAFKDTAVAYREMWKFATPAMIALMEATALEGVQPYLSDDFTTVGIDVCVKHIKATPIGMKVTCKASFTKAEEGV